MARPVSRPRRISRSSEAIRGRLRAGGPARSFDARGDVAAAPALYFADAAPGPESEGRLHDLEIVEAEETQYAVEQLFDLAHPSLTRYDARPSLGAWRRSGHKRHETERTIIALPAWKWSRAAESLVARQGRHKTHIRACESWAVFEASADLYYGKLPRSLPGGALLFDSDQRCILEALGVRKPHLRITHLAL